jgi:hypothetical protein
MPKKMKGKKPKYGNGPKTGSFAAQGKGAMKQGVSKPKHGNRMP